MKTTGEARHSELTAIRLARLLARLDSDPERAATAFESLRETLIKFFDWKGARFPDECTDDVLDRLARKLDEDVPVDDVRRFALGIARLVLLEHTRDPASRHDEFEERRHGQHAERAASAEHPLHRCLDRCLDALPGQGRALILGYYTDERRAKIDHRVRLAAELGLSANALRSRAQRLRDRLERCVRQCAAGAPTDAAT
jgi:DNA-directed RNA polymerase specialized sigma24 family protein